MTINRITSGYDLANSDNRINSIKLPPFHTMAPFFQTEDLLSFQPVAPSHQTEGPAQKKLCIEVYGSLNTFPRDLCERIFEQLDCASIIAFSSTSTHLNQVARGFYLHVKQPHLQRICPDLCILDVKELRELCERPSFATKLEFNNAVLKCEGLDPKNEPPIDFPRLIKCIAALAPKIKGNRNFTLLTMPKGFDTERLYALMQICGVLSGINKRDSRSIDFKIEETYRVLLTNGIFNDTQNKTLAERTKIVEDLKCNIPTFQDLVVRSIYHYKVNNNRFEDGSSRFEDGSSKEPALFSRLATIGYHLGFEKYSCELKMMKITTSHTNAKSADRGAGGSIRF